MGRQPCCDKVGLKRGQWTIEEDHKLTNFILNNGIICWRKVPKLAGLLRCGKSCRLRWINYLRPGLKRGSFTDSEEHQIIQLHSRLGNRWSKIASHFPGRTDNEIKNHWNTRIKKKLKQLGLDSQKPFEIEKSRKNYGNKNNMNSDSSSSNKQEAISLESRPEDDHGMKICPKKAERPEEMKATVDETNDPLNNYQMLSGSSDLDWLKESNNVSMGETACVEEEYWVDGVDSFLSWDSFVHVEDKFFPSWEIGN
ncbi:hypothetical protein ERO13_A11G065350v2 [Gossypium hirsutum]|uniref:Myb-related protein 315 n=2 Tax=Gossypium TaxID=3633 RepID=A0A1U8L491_GOSHI|nr:myb-related protein 315-like [Gossypium hirsutum]KAG4173546.1 hypothetical protein ERO13_A11G065350v2 [Gossypium hirsutum]TYJ08433.1 hypothetical protein E1A91_A11G074400v1 [Gossypium mustelinum]